MLHQVLHQVDDGLRALREHDPADELHVLGPVCLRRGVVAVLDEGREAGLGTQVAQLGGGGVPAVVRWLTVATARATTSFSISMAMVIVWLPVSSTSRLWKRELARPNASGSDHLQLVGAEPAQLRGRGLARPDSQLDMRDSVVCL